MSIQWGEIKSRALLFSQTWADACNEKKSLGKDLNDAHNQAMDYLHHIPEHELPDLVVVCDFDQFELRHLKGGEVLRFKLKDLHKHVKHFGVLLVYKVQTIRPEDPVNIKAAERMGRSHDTLKARGYQGHALEVLLVRLLFQTLNTAQALRSQNLDELLAQLAKIYVATTPNNLIFDNL
jgi:hypothetical protein